MQLDEILINLKADVDDYATHITVHILYQKRQVGLHQIGNGR